MLDGKSQGSPSPSDNVNSEAVKRYQSMAEEAVTRGDVRLATHLYLAAFEQAAQGEHTSNEDALHSLRSAWNLACRLKERALAEYIFECLEPYLTSDESMDYAEELQSLALDKLEEFGLSREEIAEMAETITEDFLNLDNNASIKLSKTSVPNIFTGKLQKLPVSLEKKKVTSAPAEQKPSEEEDEEAKLETANNERVTYKDLHGFASTIEKMHSLGVGVRQDDEYKDFVKMLNERHGIDRVSALQTYLFTSEAREDANQFLLATAGELGLPVVRMTMEDGPQGVPVLCVMTSPDFPMRLGWNKTMFEEPSILLLENLDLWTVPFSEGASEEPASLQMLSRGAREAIGMIHFAVQNPEVHVFATASREDEVAGFFYDLLEPIQVIEIKEPTRSEREDIWSHIEARHPSIRGLNREELIDLSAHMARYDIYMAAQEALEQAYKASLAKHVYVPVMIDNLYDKLAAYQPLESREYKQLEQNVLSDFRRELTHIDDLLKGGK